MKILDVQLLVSQWLHLVKACFKPWLYDLKDSHIAAKVSELKHFVSMIISNFRKIGK